MSRGHSFFLKLKASSRLVGILRHLAGCTEEYIWMNQAEKYDTLKGVGKRYGKEGEGWIMLTQKGRAEKGNLKKGVFLTRKGEHSRSGKRIETNHIHVTPSATSHSPHIF